MNHSIHTIKTGINRCYLVRGSNGAVLIDAGQPNSEKRFMKAMERIGMAPEELKLIILTHGDFDHSGSAKALRTLTGAKVAIHEKDSDIVEKGTFNWPPGRTVWGKISRAMFSPLMRKMKLQAFTPDLVLGDADHSLEPYGIHGKVIFTPGHTPGSVSMVLDSGEAFVGCLAHNFFLFTLRPRLPIYAQDIRTLKQSWKKVVDLGAGTIFPGHGNPFNVQKIMKYL